LGVAASRFIIVIPDSQRKRLFAYFGGVKFVAGRGCDSFKAPQARFADVTAEKYRLRLLERHVK
jgi:hypothetical protein